LDWLAYGEFSGFKLLPRYEGPRPSLPPRPSGERGGGEGDEFIPYNGALDKLDGPRDKRLHHAFRCGMLLHGIDMPGLTGWISATHTDADVAQTVTAVARTVELLKEEG